MAQRKMGRSRSTAIDRSKEQTRRQQILRSKLQGLGPRKRNEKDELDLLTKFMRGAKKVIKRFK